MTKYIFIACMVFSFIVCSFGQYFFYQIGFRDGKKQGIHTYEVRRERITMKYQPRGFGAQTYIESTCLVWQVTEHYFYLPEVTEE